jgi:hypothetical protein
LIEKNQEICSEKILIRGNSGCERRRWIGFGFWSMEGLRMFEIMDF